MIDVLKAYPQAASIPDCNGNLPLYLCLRSGKRWDTGVKEIFEAAPHAIQGGCIGSNLPPFMIAVSKTSDYYHHHHTTEVLNKYQHKGDAQFNEEVALLEITTAFELLRRDPCQVMVLQNLTKSSN